MDRSDLMDKLEEIQNKNYNRFKGVNEADLATREDIADLFEKLLSEAREGKEPINDAPAGGLSKHAVSISVCDEFENDFCLKCYPPFPECDECPHQPKEAN